MLKYGGLSPSYYPSRALARALILRSAARTSGSAFILGVRIMRVSCVALAWADMLDAFDARDELDIGRAALAGSIGKGPCACGWFARTWPSALGRAVGPPRCALDSR